MLQDGVSAKQVYEETGFFIDDKGRIRNDIDDVDGKDYPARKPYPIARPGEALTKARERIKAEREHHKNELEYNREYWQAENRKAGHDHKKSVPEGTDFYCAIKILRCYLK